MKFMPIALVCALSLLASGDYSNRRAPGFSLPDAHYQQHDPQDYRGKVLIVDIMATGCPYCVDLADVLVGVKAKFGDKLGILSVVTGPDNQATAERFANEHKVTWPVVFDGGQMIASYLRITPAHPQVHFPHLFLIDGDGTIRNDFDGAENQPLTVESLSAEVGKLIK